MRCGRCPLDRKLAAEKIRARLERRLATLLACEAKDLPPLRLGELVHLSFLLWGDSEELGGFNPTIHAVVEIVGGEILWESPKAEATETTETKVVVN
jgi:hypothetical protein